MSAQSKRSARGGLVVAILAIACAANAHAIDLQPEDGIAPAASIQAVQLGVINSQRSGFYVDGRKIAANPKLDSQQAYVRLIQTFQWSSKPSAVYLQLPYGSIKTQALGASDRPSNVGDLVLMAATWPYVDRVAHEFFGIAGYLVLPTGDYDPRFTAGFVNTNIAENRYRAAVQAGYHRRIWGGLGWQAALDATVFTDNDAFGYPVPVRLSRKPLYAAQTSLSYRLTPQIGIGASYFYTAGGETARNGIDRNDQVQVQRAQFTGFYQLSAQLRLTLQYGADIKTRSGLKEDGLYIVRLTRFF